MYAEAADVGGEAGITMEIVPEPVELRAIMTVVFELLDQRN